MPRIIDAETMFGGPVTSQPESWTASECVKGLPEAVQAYEQMSEDEKAEVHAHLNSDRMSVLAMGLTSAVTGVVELLNAPNWALAVATATAFVASVNAIITERRNH